MGPLHCHFQQLTATGAHALQTVCFTSKDIAAHLQAQSLLDVPDNLHVDDGNNADTSCRAWGCRQGMMMYKGACTDTECSLCCKRVQTQAA